MARESSFDKSDVYYNLYFKNIMKQLPQPRKRVYDLYWYFAAERQAIYERRIMGAKPPWTKDAILQKYKFCNVYRAADRVSQYMIRSVACNPVPGSLDDQLFQIVAFRMFSKIETWEGIKKILGRPPIIADLNNDVLVKTLEKVKQRIGVIYTGAFILCANNAFGFSKKHLNHIALFKKMFADDGLAGKLRAATSLEAVYELLHQYPLMGDFMSYQIAIDLNYSSQINFSENDFCQVGPGAIRGIKKAFISLGDYTPNEVVDLMVERQAQEFKRLGLQFNGLWGRPLHAIDCQGLFCEVDKYCREAVPEILSERQRIKSKFSASHDSLTLFFPPKWNLNNKLPKKKVFGQDLDDYAQSQLCIATIR
jgi:hypothetical protein